MRYVSVIKRFALTCLLFCISFGAATNMAKAEIEIETLGGQATMAEQGAICASFAALMENQILLNIDLGQLWSERRKFSGAVIRRAVELSGKPSPESAELDQLINDYREWLLLNLSSRNTATSISEYQTDVQNLIKTNCATLFIQADKAILNRYPGLRYLIDGPQPTVTTTIEDQKQIEALLQKNNELNTKLVSLSAEISALRLAAKQTDSSSQAQASQAPTQTETPTPRPVPPKKPVSQKTPQTTQKTNSSNDAQAGRFFAQLGSYSTKAFAQNALGELTNTHKTLLQNMSLTIQPHAFASGKTFFRIRTSNASRQQITAICDRLWDARMGCLIKTNID